VRLKASDFTEYLGVNGLDSILELVEELGEEKQAAVERYAKWAKAVVDVGEAEPGEAEPVWSRPVGHILELVPVTNPNGVAPGEQLAVRVLYEGEPLVGASVVAARAGGPGGEILTKTKDDGVAELRISSAGRWYARAIHMIRRDADPEIRWESFWATLTFEVRDAQREGSPQ